MERVRINHIHKDKFTRAAVINAHLRKSSYALIDIEAEFLDELFDEKTLESYRELYNKYCDKYKEAAEYWDKKTCNIIEINVNYFSQHYFPLEG